MKLKIRWLGSRRSGREGAILGLVLGVLVLLSLLGVGLIGLGAADGIETSKAIGTAQAFWAAEAGLQMAKALGQKYQVSYEQIRDSGPQIPLNRTYALSSSSCAVQIQTNAMNGATWIQRYDIVSTGTHISGITRAVTQHAEIQTFASYAHASNSEGGIFFGPGDRIDGMVYSNDQINLYGGTPNPVFLQMVQSAKPTFATAFNFQNGATTNVFQGGYQFNVPALNFNVLTTLVATIQGKPGTTTLPAGDYALRFTGGSWAYRPWAGTNWTTNALSSGDNAIYINGSVLDLSGVVSGRVTVAVENVIQLTSNLVYQSAPADATLYASNYNLSAIRDVLGLVAQNGVTIMGTNAIDIQAAILVTSQGFKANQNYNSFGQPPINLFGSLAQYQRGIVGYVSGLGFRKNYKYDTRMLSNPPPYFPWSLYAFSAWRQSG